MFALTLFFGFQATKLDPTDPAIYLQRHFDEEPSFFDQDQEDSHERKDFLKYYTAFCTVCQMKIEKDTKHCASCNRCTKGFDHHCFWLNNCIGHENYSDFIKATVFCCLYGLSTIALSIVFIKSILMYIFSACCLLMSLGLFQLSLFHLYLWWKGISTFTYIKF